MHVLKELLRANHQQPGLKTLKLFRLDPRFFARLKAETLALAASNTPSRADYAGHVSHWSRPFGTVVQYSLLNRSGRCDDTLDDHKPELRGKEFRRAGEYPAIAEFIGAFPDAYNMRVWGMGPASGLSKHKEHLYLKVGLGSYMLRARFHLPVQTSERAEMYLDGDYVRFEEGCVYLFNNGCVHTATNGGDAFRYHFVWDMLLTERATAQMFGAGDPPPAWLERLEGDDRVVPVVRTEEIGEYAVQHPPLVYRLGLAHLGVKPYQLHAVQNLFSYYRSYYLRSPAYVPADGFDPE